METMRERPQERLDMSDDHVELRTGVSWTEFLAFVRGKRKSERVTYLDGELEVVSPGANHEDVKSLIGILFERYLCELRIDGIASGSWLQTVKALRIGIEPDESYIFGTTRRLDRCDLAIEVIATSGTTRKLEIYRRLGVPEVWFWIRGRITIYVLGDAGYTAVPRSRFVPELDPALLERLLHHRSYLAATDALLAELAAAKPPR